jgi:5-methylcytosine-specific restriction protein A
MTENQSQPLSTQRVEQIDMNKPDTAHIAGFFDAAGTISGHIVKGGATIGYRFEPMVRITRPAEDSYIFGKIDEYCSEHGVHFSLNEVTRNGTESFEFVIKQPNSVTRFLEPLMPYFVTQFENSQIMLSFVIPSMEQRKHLTKPGFYEIIKALDEIRDETRQGKNPKYTAEFFREEWSEDLAA